jgi:hypothetical protein
MNTYNHIFKISAIFICTLFISVSVFPCSMFKITMYGKTMVGNNEDAWRLDSKIWFETGKDGKYGTAYVGHNDLFPQGGMNEMGLVYDGFAVYPRKLTPVFGKINIDNPSSFLKMILQNCKSVREVHNLINQYDRSIFNNSMLLFVDITGEYLVVEVDTVISGNNREYILSNFCPSITKPSEVKIPRYIRGNLFLNNNLPDSSLKFCLSVMDTMHVCRTKIGDGTTYTSIYDLNEGFIYLYFYHDFKHVVKFNLHQELGKGDHIVRMLDIFPSNPEYLRFKEYITPFNSLFLRLTLYALIAFYISTAFVYISIINRYRMYTNIKIGDKSRKLLVRLIFPINIILAYYLYILLTNLPMYYFDSPYKFDNNNLLNVFSYFPILLLAVIIPIIYTNIRMERQRVGSKYTRVILALNSFTYIFVLTLFGYWGFYKVF